MQEKIEEAQVRTVAKLARLDLSDAQISEFTVQLRDIVGYVEAMNELDTDGVEPLAHCLPISNCLREDVVRESLGTDKTLQNAPDTDGEYFIVPKILDDSSAA